MPAEVAEVTTAARTPCAAQHRGRDVMNECFTVAPCRGSALPRAQDAGRVGIMRRIAAARLRYCGLAAMTDDVMLIVSELLTNALLHSGAAKINLHIAVKDDTLSVTVRDGMPGAAEIRAAADGDESGRGLLLVDALVRENGGAWGTSDDGAETWCSLPVPEGEEQ